ncbi:MFS general substrate transporter [Heliocybe sulcata]|uniref:MFS general substrate transporter n=1 Tax=Heliocybe sulcata TaxID=5364 RepID=A0A5C3N799_9AGAM|nr:MFS general substrate transporter [Heliocybe sulcata]
MATPRASGLWEDDRRMSYFSARGEDNGDDIEEQLEEMEEGDAFDERSNLDRTIDRIGMGSYQWVLLSLCGFGWLADNMWIQAVAIILPRVQVHFLVPDSYLGAVSSAMFAGMMVGAVGWGTCSDMMGRSTAFNLTLFFTAVFGILASFANSFFTLALSLFLLGSAVGGSMPTDGTLILEYIPKGKQYLVTALSVFFSIGSVLAAVVALLVVPQHSCRTSDTQLCNVDEDNKGWKYLLMALGLLTLSMFIARILFFRLHESPRYLVNAGRKREAVQALQMISQYNGDELSIGIHDVDDTPRDAPSKDDAAATPFLSQESPPAAEQSRDIVFDADAPASATLSPGRPRSADRQSSRAILRTNDGPDYHSTGSSPATLDAQAFTTPNGTQELPTSTSGSPPTYKEASPPATPPTSAAQRPRQPRMHSRRLSTSSSMYEMKRKVGWALPRSIRRPILAWIDRMAMVLEPEWIRTTVLVWAVWCTMSLAYTMFNVYLPKLLETGTGPDVIPKTLEESLWDVVIFTLGGCPGALVGAWMIKSSLGRKRSLALSTSVTAFFCMVFIHVEAAWAVRASTVGISLSSTTMWAVLYGWTPDIFDTSIRGTACGIASALSRIGGMIAPMLGGVLLMIDRSVPVYTSVVVFLISTVCVLMLDGGDGPGGGGGGVVH